ncbi:glycosyltransferase [Microbacterium sp. MRS-1]|uniref:glycosyltransferase n=1 Tax=Microbacterium sp. MRS-1 TaxID=1451261 RepID=UPI0012DCC6A2|nr:glycosyltransferase [Microbacterium sp. MRS-1]
MKTSKERNQTVVIYIKDGPESSSAHYRILQYVSRMTSPNVKVRLRVLAPGFIWRSRYDAVGRSGTLYPLIAKLCYICVVSFRGVVLLSWDALIRRDVVIVLRSVLPKLFNPLFQVIYSATLRRAGTVVWDLDDDLSASGEISAGEARLLSRSANYVVVTHEELLRTLPRPHGRVQILNTTDGDFSRRLVEGAEKDRIRALETELRIVWIGSSSGLRDLESILPQLDRAAQRIRSELGKRVVLRVVCNLPLSPVDVQHLNVDNVRWARSTAVDIAMSSHVGVMPLLPSKFARGKGAFKLIQYMAAGLPVIASQVGHNSRVVRDGVGGWLVADGDVVGWEERVVALARNSGLWVDASREARQEWVDRFDFEEAQRFWMEVVRASA